MSKKYNYVYKTINLLNGEFYIGLRSSNVEPEHDKYYGSGIRIKNSIVKHGIENFKKEIIAIFDTREEASNKEYDVVDKEILKTPLCLNLKTGGDFYMPHYTPSLYKRYGKDNPNYGNRTKATPEIIEKRRLAMINSEKFQNSRKSSEFKLKISTIQSREVAILNSNFEILMTFKNCRFAAEHFGFTKANITQAIRFKRIICKGKQTKKYVCYYDDYENSVLQLKLKYENEKS